MKRSSTYFFWLPFLLNLWFMISASSYASYEMGPEFPPSIYPEYSNKAQTTTDAPADQREVEAQVRMGLEFLTGSKGIVDENQAFRWLKIAELEGSEEASVYLASMFFYGQGTQQNYAEAFRRFSKAAQYGNSLAQFNLHVMYDIGYGVIVNKDKALYWLRQSAQNGFAPAQSKLGLMYKTGGLVDRDLKKSISLFRLAAEKGDKLGQIQLAKNYALGIGVEQNNFISYLWLNVAGKECKTDTLEMQCQDFRNNIASTLSKQEIERAGKLTSIKRKSIARNVNIPTIEKVIIQ